MQERLFQAWSYKQEENIKNVFGQRDCTQICKSLIPRVGGTREATAPPVGSPLKSLRNHYQTLNI